MLVSVRCIRCSRACFLWSSTSNCKALVLVEANSKLWSLGIDYWGFKGILTLFIQCWIHLCNIWVCNIEQCARSSSKFCRLFKCTSKVRVLCLRRGDGWCITSTIMLRFLVVLSLPNCKGPQACSSYICTIGNWSSCTLHNGRRYISGFQNIVWDPR